METLERESAWKEEEFDFVLQTLRTVLLKRSSSLLKPVLHVLTLRARWRVPNLYNTFCDKSTPAPDTFITWYPATIKKTSIEA
jgi:hypothetical protein